MDSVKASKLITDEYCAKILVATYRRPKNAVELSRNLGIPIAAVYRRIHLLVETGLMRLDEKALTKEGKRINQYISELRNAYIFFEKGNMKVRFEMKSGAIETYGGEWENINLSG